MITTGRRKAVSYGDGDSDGGVALTTTGRKTAVSYGDDGGDGDGDGSNVSDTTAGTQGFGAVDNVNEIAERPVGSVLCRGWKTSGRFVSDTDGAVYQAARLAPMVVNASGTEGEATVAGKRNTWCWTGPKST